MPILYEVKYFQETYMNVLCLNWKHNWKLIVFYIAYYDSLTITINMCVDL